MNQTPIRELRVFISSTFNDLKKERSFLMSSVFPKLISTASERGIVLTPIDLRWGVVPKKNGGGSRTSQIVDACLKEIDNSQCFIGIVGEREGWLPDPGDLEKSDLLKGEFEELAHTGLSMTEIEIQYGVLRREKHPPAYFFIKDIEDGAPVSNERLRNDLYIKEKELGFTIRNYSDARSLSELVEEAVLRTLDSVFPGGDLSPEEKEDFEQQFTFDSLTNGYIPDEALFQEIDEGLERGRCVCITAFKGSGKSALLANWIARKKEEKDSNLLVACFLNHKGSAITPGHLSRRMCREISRLVDSPIDESLLKVSPFQMLQELCDKTPNRKQLVLAIGNAEEQCIKISRWITELPSSVKIIYSADYSNMNVEFAISLDYPVVCIFNSPQKRASYIRQYLKTYGKDLDEDLVRHLAETLPGSFETLRAMLDILIQFGKHDSIRNLIYAFDKPLDHYVDRETKPRFDFYRTAVLLYESFYPNLPVKDILAAITFVRGGIREMEIADFVGITPQEWIYFKSGLKPFWAINDGFVTTTIENLGFHLSHRDKNIEKDILQRAIHFYGENGDTFRESYNRAAFFRIEKDTDSFIHALFDINFYKFLRRHDNNLLVSFWDSALSMTTERKPLSEFGAYLMDREIREAYNLEADDYISLLLDAARFCIDSFGHSKVALNLARKAHEIAVNCPTNMNDAPFMKINRTISEALFMEESFDEAYDFSNSAIMSFQKNGGRFSSDLGMCFRIRAASLCKKGLYEESLSDINDAKSIILGTNGLADEGYIKCLLSEGRIHQEHREYKLAFDCFNKAFAYEDVYLGPSHPVTDSILTAVSYLYFLQGDYVRAIDFIRSTDSNDYTFDNAHARYVHGLIWFKKRHSEAALFLFKKATDIMERIDRTGSLYSSAQEFIVKCNKRLWFKNLFKRKRQTDDSLVEWG